MPGILHALERAGQQVATRLSGDFAGALLTAAETDLLFHLIHGGSGQAPIGKLRRAAGRTPSTTTAVVDRLERAGLATRHPNPEDRRSYLIVLTPRGRQVAKAVAERVQQIERELQGRLKPADIDGFHAVITALENLK